MKNRHRCKRGFTLLELMVTLAVASVLVVIAVPSFRDLLRRNQVSSASNALLADLSYARSEASMRGSIVSICPSTDGTTCTSTQAYESGWLVYTYSAGHSVAATAYDASKPATNLLLRHTMAREGVSLQADSADIVSFGPQGQLLPTGSTHTFWTCFRPKGESGGGSSTGKVPGAELAVNGSGSTSSKKLTEKTSCLFS